MKKYLMTGIAALALCVGFTSCSHDVEQLSQEEMTELQNQQMVLNYQKAFVATFGQPAANHKWGFVDYSQTRTRTADPGDHGAYFSGSSEQQSDYYKAMGIVAPDMVSEDEENFVTNWFRTHPNLQSEDVDLSTFFVQQVHFGTQKYTTSTGHEVVGGEHMDWLCAYDPAGHTETIHGQAEFGYQPHTYTTHDDHINNFNTSAPLRYYKEGGWTNNREYQASMMLMVNSSTERFGFSESFNTNPASSDANRNPDNKRIYYNYVLVSITYNGKTNYYVGFDYECHGNQGDLEPNGLYDDRIIKIVPGNGVVPSEWDLRIIAEDLNAQAQAGDTEDSDWDFNDVVLDVKFLEETDQVKIRVTAAGATLPIRINGEDALEVHGLYGQPTNIMINTGAAAAGYPSQAYESNGVYPSAAIFERTISGVDAAYGANIKIEVEKTINGEKTWIELTAKPGEPAAKMGVLPDYVYCNERQDIKSRYSGFVAWVATQNPVYWWRSNNQ